MTNSGTEIAMVMKIKNVANRGVMYIIPKRSIVTLLELGRFAEGLVGGHTRPPTG